MGLEAVKVWHCNDAKAAMGSKLDRHEHIGEGTIGAAAFRRLLHDERFAHAAFIAETPVDEPGDETRNVGVLRTLARGESFSEKRLCDCEPSVRLIFISHGIYISVLEEKLEMSTLAMTHSLRRAVVRT